MNSSYKGNAAQISVAFARVIFRYLQRHGIDPKPLLATHGLTEDLLRQDDQLIPMTVFLALLNQTASMANDPFLGLHIYEDMDFTDLGLLGYAMLNATTLSDYWQASIRYYNVYQGESEQKLIIKEDCVEFTYRITDTSLPYCRHDSEMSILFDIMFLRQLLGDDWTPRAVHFQHPAPSETDEYQRVIQAPVVFNQPTNKLIVERSLLDFAITSADQRLFNVLKASLETLQSRLHTKSDLEQTIKDHIAHTIADEIPNVEQTAKQLHMSVRTLQRRLSDANLTYSELIDETRKMLAEQYLEETRLPQTEIASLLGYSGSKAFYRAFTRWHGVTPQDYRKTYGMQN
ncbi:AraC family transcriptional regulator [Aestuariicella sp. G3-2]|uniref:AraC family transcriptional regulator n=1 Tax=Pseudomaricurvus albidus TaxID=2842452 RepID=UPI001C0C60CB|nr:AraC family transcriptional regulator [Aestuariicella albida]MBU3068392.1 AraC family transcriptional regulator [Aestuariicella albida]